MKIVLKQMVILFITMIPASVISMALKTLCALINLPEEPVYMVSTNIYSILCLVFYRCSTNHSRKIKLDELVDTRILRPAEWIRCCLIVLGGSAVFSSFTEWIIDVINFLFGEQVLTSGSVENLIENVPASWLILCGVIIAPILEELLFRQFLLENLLPYGTGKAVLTSLFGAVILPGVPMDSEVIIVIVLVLGGIVSAGIEIRKYYMQKARGSLTS